MQKAIEFSIHTVLFATDMSESSVTALSYATGIAAKYGAKLIVVHVLDTSGVGGLAGASPSELRSATNSARSELERVVKGVASSGIISEVLVRYGSVPDVIFQIQHEYAAAILVLGSSGRKVGRGRGLGSITEAILRSMPCSVLTVGPSVQQHIFASQAQEILFPTDFSEVSLIALPFAISFAVNLSANLLLLHVFDRNSPECDYGDEAVCEIKLKEIMASAKDRGIAVEYTIKKGGVADSIVSCAQEKNADFIVMGAHRGDLSDGTRLHGKIYDIIRNARCPVLTLVDPGRSSQSKTFFKQHIDKGH